VIAPVWLIREVVLMVHERQIAEHGGAPGVRDLGLLESALARPINLYGYGEADLCHLAAAYAFGIIRNHPFVDGNKRVGFVASYIFLRINGVELIADEHETVLAVQSLAAGDLSEKDFAEWLRRKVGESL